MEVKFIKCVSSKLSSVPIVDGQVICLTDSNGVLYDMDGTRKYASKAYSISDAYKTSAGAASSGVAASSKAVADAYAEINSNLETGLLVTYYHISHSEKGHYGDVVTTAKRLCSTMTVNGVVRKFSDYDYLCFELLVNSNTIRASMVIPRVRFIEHKYNIELTYVDSTNTQRWVSVEYNSDTSYYLHGSSNIATDTRVAITGMVAMPKNSIIY